MILHLLALTRLLYEQFFPHLPWLGSPWVVGVVAIGAAIGIWAEGQRHRGAEEKPIPSAPPLLRSSALLLLPALLILLPPEINLLRGWLLWFGGWWVVAVSRQLVSQSASQRSPSLLSSLFSLLLLLAPIYFLTLGRTVGSADTFEFQVVVPQLGIVHPTGYPLYLLLGKLWTLLIPFGQLAFRLNVGTAVYALGAAMIVLELVRRGAEGQGSRGAGEQGRLLTSHLSLFTASLFALRPTFWGQAVEAEVYTLHNLIVAAVLFLLLRQLQQPTAVRLLWTAALITLGLTNHLTTILLAPVALLVAIFTWQSWRADWRWLLGRLPLTLLPLTLYAYLPLRWAAVNDEPMGWGRFLGWITGSQFQDALQLWAWWRDPTRYAVVGRLFVAEWTWLGLTVALLGLGWLAWHNWRWAAVLATTWAGYTFYCLNYYVPDLAVFLQPAHLIIALCIGAGLIAVSVSASQLISPSAPPLLRSSAPLLPLALFPLLLWHTAALWPSIDRSQNWALAKWGTAVLAQPLASNGVILADSEKIAPLFYLQQAEGLRPDLAISVQPDEAAYRAQLTAALEAGRTVYLARYLPGLEGAYYLRSAGPLTEVGTAPLTSLPPTAEPRAQTVAEGIQLVGIELEPASAGVAGHTAVTFYWQVKTPLPETWHIYVRWAGGSPINPAGQHPAHNYYPTTAWKDGEIVADHHLLPHPYPPVATADLQIAFASPFSRALAWQTVATVDLPAVPPILPHGRPVRITAEGGAWLDEVSWPPQLRPQAGAFPGRVNGNGVEDWEFTLEPAADLATAQGTYGVVVSRGGERLSCGWLRPWATSCKVGEVVVSGAAVPEGATNFGDQIALLNVQLDPPTLVPGGQQNVTVQWQALASMSDDYTVFVQVVNSGGVVVQVDSWPLQGTYPTSQWRIGEVIRDPYVLYLPAELPEDNYQLLIGLYRLADLQRVPVLAEQGFPVDDKATFPLAK
ncbi:MAG: DUF2723 domain-containing protein [Chloroflexi bacterium]|nr:DUF2723 domain-containing protein [Chloroflexota bacterium]